MSADAPEQLQEFEQVMRLQAENYGAHVRKLNERARNAPQPQNLPRVDPRQVTYVTDSTYRLRQPRGYSKLLIQKIYAPSDKLLSKRDRDGSKTKNRRQIGIQMVLHPAPLRRLQPMVITNKDVLDCWVDTARSTTNH